VQEPCDEPGVEAIAHAVDDGDGIGSDVGILYNASPNQMCPISMTLWMGVIHR
jgi:hypothetical protein